MSYTLEMFGGPFDGCKIVSQNDPPAWVFPLPTRLGDLLVGDLPVGGLLEPSRTTRAIYSGRKWNPDRNPHHIRYDFLRLE